jgi:hypothetical protein
LAMALLFGGVWCALITIGSIAKSQEAKKDAKPTLEEAFRKWDMGFSSDKTEERVNALRSMFPTKKELAYLFPKQVDKLWPKFEEGHRFMEENVDLIAKEITRGGAITKIKPIDARADKARASGSYKELLAIIPKDVQVVELVVSRDKSTSGSGTYLFMKDRWFWVKDLETFPGILEKFK